MLFFWMTATSIPQPTWLVGCSRSFSPRRDFFLSSLWLTMTFTRILLSPLHACMSAVFACKRQQKSSHGRPGYLCEGSQSAPVPGLALVPVSRGGRIQHLSVAVRCEQTEVCLCISQTNQISSSVQRERKSPDFLPGKNLGLGARSFSFFLL